MRWAVPEAEFVDPGTLGCQGCGGALSMRLVLKEVGDDAIAVLPACCWSIIDGPWPTHALRIPAQADAHPLDVRTGRFQGAGGGGARPCLHRYGHVF